MAQIEEKSKKSTSIDNFAESFDIADLSEKEKKYYLRIRSADWAIQSADRSINLLKEFDANKDHSKSATKKDELRKEFENTKDKAQNSKSNNRSKEFKELNGKAVELCLQCHTQVHELIQKRTDISDDRKKELLQLLKENPAKFQKKAAVSLFECEWNKVSPQAGPMYQELNNEKYEAAFMAVGEKDLAAKSVALASVFTEAHTATGPDRQDFKAGVQGIKAFIKQFPALKQEFGTHVKNCQPSISTSSKPEKQLISLNSLMHAERLHEEPGLNDNEFLRIKGIFEQASAFARDNKQQQRAAQVMQLGLSEYVVAFQKWKTLAEEAQRWDKTSGDRQRRESVVSAILADVQRQPPTDQTIAPKAADYLQRAAAIRTMNPGKTVKDKIMMSREWDKHKDSLRILYSDLTKAFASQLKPTPDEQFKADRQKNGEDGPEAVLKRTFPNATPNSCKFRLLAAKHNNAKLPDNLTLADAGVIAAYTDDSTCKKLNGILNGVRDPADDNEQNDFHLLRDAVANAIAKLPQYPTNTARGESVWAGAIERYKEGNEFTIKAFWSTSFGNQFSGVFQLAIKPKKQGAGRNIQMLSEIPNENEVIFPPGSSFKVVKVDGTIEAGRVDVSLEEV